MTNKVDFGAKLKELEAITEWFESDEVDLDAALAKFERGMELATELKKELGEVENRVEKIKQRFDVPSAADSASQPTQPSSTGDGSPQLF